MCDRVCIDTIMDMKQGEGMLIGNFSNAFFLVHMESVESTYIEPRPFRANAGAVHAFILMPGGRDVSLIRQNSETIRLTRSSGAPVLVVQRSKDDKVPGYAEEGSRHFGFKVKETISEKIFLASSGITSNPAYPVFPTSGNPDNKRCFCLPALSV